jgi:hypothetical protein
VTTEQLSDDELFIGSYRDDDGDLVEVYDDGEVFNPREECNVGVMLFDPRAGIPTEDDAEALEILEPARQVRSPAEAEAAANARIAPLARHLRRTVGARVVLPIYVYNHSGRAVSTVPFGCAYDSGFYGVIYDTPRNVLGCLGEGATDTLIERALQSEVRGLNSYLHGEPPE